MTYFLRICASSVSAVSLSLLSLIPSAFSAEEIVYNQQHLVEKTQFAIQVTGGAGNLTGASLQSANPVTLDLAFQPIHSFGVIGFGVYIGYGTPASNGVAELANTWTTGFRFQYQAKYWEQQVFVPVGAFHLGRWFYEFESGAGDAFLSYGGSAGIWIDLSSIDFINGNRIYRNWGISRFYLTSEYENTQGEDGQVKLDQGVLRVGIRAEI